MGLPSRVPPANGRPLPDSVAFGPMSRLPILAWLLFPAVALAADAPAPGRPQSPAAPPAAELSWLSAKGPQLVDAADRRVVLRGVSLGGWLVEEMWMQPIVTQAPQGATCRRSATTSPWTRSCASDSATGDGGAFRSAMRDAWVNESDFDRIRDAGFNHVRLPFLYDLVEEPGGLEWLDRAIDWAGKRGLYVILDLHGAPGARAATTTPGRPGKIVSSRTRPTSSTPGGSGGRSPAATATARRSPPTTC